MDRSKHAKSKAKQRRVQAARRRPTYAMAPAKSGRLGAHQAIGEARVLRLSVADQELFFKTLLAPSGPTRALRRAFARRRKLVE